MDDRACFMNNTEGAEKPRIVIHKSRRTLEAYDGGSLVARMHIALGRDESGPKTRSGDMRTPEGVYSICVRNEKSKYHLALGLNYPNLADAERGLAAGVIGRMQYDAIAGAVQSGQRPPWDTPMGGEIMIHGGGSGRDWTAGCIALDNDCMDFLWKIVEIGTEVEIKP